MCMGALSDCAAHAAQCPQRPEEGISSPRTEVIDGSDFG